MAEPPRPLAELVQVMSKSYGRAELPVSYAVIRFHAGRCWVAPLGTELGPDTHAGSRPPLPWQEVAVDG